MGWYVMVAGFKIFNLVFHYLNIYSVTKNITKLFVISISGEG